MPAWETPGRVRRCEEAEGDSGVAFGAADVGTHGFDFELEVRRFRLFGQERVVLQGGEERDVREEDCVLASGVCADGSTA